jgi:hypothetical protein
VTTLATDPRHHPVTPSALARAGLRVVPRRPSASRMAARLDDFADAIDADGSPAGSLAAEQLRELARLVRLTGAEDVETFRDRLEAWGAAHAGSL